MDCIKQKRILFYLTPLYILGYYFWIYYWKNDEWIKTFGGNLFSIFAPLIAFVLLLQASRKMKKVDKVFWFLISLGCLSYSISETLWFFIESIQKKEVPFPGWTDLFYIVQTVFFMSAFIYKIIKTGKGLHLIKFAFDTCIIMTVAITFSWHFIMHGIIFQSNTTPFSMMVSVSYPIGDLILLFGAISFYFGSESFFPSKVINYILISLIIQALADSAFLYLTADNIYFSGSLLDPLWSLGFLLMAISGTYARERYGQKNLMKRTKRISLKDILSIRLLLPYLSVCLLFLVMVLQNKSYNSLMIGSAVAISLVILRQIFTLLENNSLISQYHNLTEELEQKISERTEELTVKNQQLEDVVQKMRHMAFHDVLSGLPNRRLFLEKLEQAIDAAEQHGNCLAVVFIDIDRFKNINDTLGHEFGDLLVKYVSKQMAQSLRSTDTLSRQGGDEFTILLDNIHKKEDVIPILQKLQSVVAMPITIKEKELHISLSIGVAFYPKDGRTTEELLKNADMAMYRAKEDGRNNFKFFSKDMNLQVSRKMTLENGLRSAIKNDEFIIYYQPQVDIQTGKVVGVESLIRWNTREAGMVPPGEFISVAEETHLIIPMGEWVLYTACKQAKAWHDAGNNQLKLAVNLSPLQFVHEDLVKMVAHVLDETGFNPKFLELEITEGVALNDAEEAIDKMQDLRNLGVRISIDDFGTGYSSFIYLKRFPINTLKIAQPFVHDLISKHSNKALVETIVSLAHSLGLTVIAEGVETHEQLVSLKEMHCDEVQGYYYSKPLTVMQFTSMIENQAKEIPLNVF
ncbi:DUF4084 domain-containing protein [Bacillus sp. JJ1764]|uniref:DUF4084 domain-containing protein n=1 Tax=Bacillus sp. JJ1764 TaxID=3122964 RepID=UPI002FFDBB12